VTVLLADLKGSMELMADRDPEEARQLLDPVLEQMMEAVHHYEGTVNQVMGDGIMALFGAPIAHEDHALRACYAALRMLDSVGRYGDEVQRSRGVSVQIRVGLNSGEVVVRSIGSDLHMDYTAVGQTTHLAARMEQMARPGSALLTPATLRLAEGYVQVRSLGPVAIKGLAEPMEVFQLLGAGASRTRLQVAAGRGLTEFVGRDAELEHLRAALDSAREGRGQVVALVGEPGVGKSRLVWELVRSHRVDGWLVLESSAVSYGKGTALLPVRDLLRGYLGIEGREDVRRLREKLTGKVLALDEGLRSDLPALSALLELSIEDAAWRSLGVDQQRQRVLEAVKRLLLRESQEQPLLLVLEDLHWVDADTQAVLDGLVESLPSHRVLLLSNFRPEYQHAWGSKTYYGQIRLDPLARATAEALLETLLGSDPDLAALKSLLIERSQGNPLFLEEGVRGLVETGVLAGQRGAYRLVGPVQAAQVPATVQAILAARIDRLSPEDKSLLQSAAVVGEDVPLSILRGIAGLPEEELLAGLRRLQAAEFIHEARLFPEVEYAFRHPLTHEVAYASLLNERRRALHAGVVATIERLHPAGLAAHRDRLVHHAFRGELWGKAFAYLRDLDEVASDATVAEVMGIGPESPGQLWWSGEHERALRVAERDLTVAASFGNFGLRVVATCRFGQAHHALGNYQHAADLLGQIVSSLQGEVAHETFGMAGLPSVFARSYLAWCLAEQGNFAEGAAIGEEALGIAEAAESAYSQGHIAFGLGTHYVVQGNPDRAIALLERALVVTRMANVPFLFPFLIAPLGAAHALAGDPARAVLLLEQAIEQAGAMKLRAHHALRLTWLARARLLEGRRDLAIDHARRALDLARECKERGHEAHAQVVLADALAASQEPDAAAVEGAYREALGMAGALGMRPLAARCHLGLGRLLARAGDEERARSVLRTAEQLLDSMGMVVWLAEAREALDAR
jgi:class 3 adenylate cyclase/tetratricopeptide (TPR) repeat protein